MAVIKIPSKHIYSKNFDPVIDNNIDKIESELSVPIITNKNGDVYNEQLRNGFYLEEAQTSKKGFVHSVTSNFKQSLIFRIAYISILPQYIKKQIKIPVNSNNKQILKVFDKLDENGNANIKVSMSGTLETGTLKGNISVTYNYPYIDAPVNNVTNLIYQKEKEEILSYELFHKNKTYKEQISVGSYSAETTLEFQNSDNVISAEFKKLIEQGTEYFSIELICLCGLKTENIGIAQTVDYQGTGDYTLSFPQYSDETKYEKYTPQAVNITIDGLFVEFSLDSNYVTIGNGNNVLSFHGNELMQTINIPSIQTQYQEVIEQYKNGKAVATIRCSIDDYYSNEPYEKQITNNTVIMATNVYEETIQNASRYVVVFTPTQAIDFGKDDFVTLNCVPYGNPFGGNFKLTVYKNEQSGSSYRGILVDGTIAPTKGERYRVSYQSTHIVSGKLISTNDTSLPMTFHIGDNVVPYVYGANGQDKPMSLKKDGTPKKFKVLGKKVIYDGGIWQELTLQETE